MFCKIRQGFEVLPKKCSIPHFYLIRILIMRILMVMLNFSFFPFPNLFFKSPLISNEFTSHVCSILRANISHGQRFGVHILFSSCGNHLKFTQHHQVFSYCCYKFLLQLFKLFSLVYDHYFYMFHLCVLFFS
jgi:hypothetical protein